jgi:hypothetical protein
MDDLIRSRKWLLAGTMTIPLRGAEAGRKDLRTRRALSSESTYDFGIDATGLKAFFYRPIVRVSW